MLLYMITIKIYNTLHNYYNTNSHICIHMHVYNPGDLLFEGHVGVLVGVARPVSSRPLLLLPLPTLPFVIWGTKRILAIDRERER